MGINLWKPVERILRASDVMPGSGVFTPRYRVSTLYADRLLIFMNYQPVVADGTSLLMRVEWIGDDGSFYPLTLEDGTVVDTAGLGYVTTVKPAIKRLEVADVANNLSYELDVEAQKSVALSFAEDGIDFNGALGVSVQLRNR